MRSLQLGMVALGICVASGMALGGYFVGQTMYNGKVAVNTAEVKGLAERKVRADMAEWTVAFKLESTDRQEVPQLYKRAEMIQQAMIKMLENDGFSADELSPGVIEYSSKEYRDKEQNLKEEKFTLSGSVNVSTAQIDKVEPTRAKVNMLITRNVDVINYAPVYRFTKLNEIKPEMLREAAQNARLAAEEFASNAGVRVGGIRQARQGAFIIRDAGEEYGDRVKIEKDIRVVTNIEFYLTN